jgi:hypothetical protein
MGTGSSINGEPRFDSWPIDFKKYAEACEKRAGDGFDVDLDTFRSMNINVEYFDLI